MPLNIWDKMARSTPAHGLSSREVDILHETVADRVNDAPWRGRETRREFFAREFDRGRLGHDIEPEFIAVQFIGITIGRRATELGLLTDGHHSSGFHFTLAEMEQIGQAEQEGVITFEDFASDAEPLVTALGTEMRSAIPGHRDEPGQLEYLIGRGIAARASQLALAER